VENKKYRVRWTESCSVLVEAQDEVGAIRKVKNGEIRLAKTEMSYGHEAEASGGE